MKRALAILMVLALLVANVPPVAADSVTGGVFGGAIMELSVKNLPDKTEYMVGEYLDTTGLVLTAIYSDGSTEDITEGFYVDYFDPWMYGNQTVYVEYEGFRTSFDVTVISVTGLSVKTLPDKTEYFRGEGLDTKGLVLTVTYSNGTTKDITDGFYIDWFDSYMTGVHTVNVSYEGHSTAFEVTVINGGYCGDNLYWELDEYTGTLTISGTGAMSDWNNPWNEWASSITAVVIEDGVTNIGSSAFYNCYNLTTVTIPDSVTSIGNSAFDGCSNLLSVSIPAGVTYIGEGAFRFCSSLTEITIPDGVTYINNETFYNCTGLAEVTIPNSITGIGSSVFGYCSQLAGIDLPNTITEIGYEAFYDCYNLTHITIPEGITYISDRMFYNCSSLTSVTIPAGVTNIAYSVFESCGSLTTVNYKGYEENKSNIMIDFGNDALVSANWIYREGAERTGIAVKTQPEKMEYWVNEELDITGLTVEVIYSDGARIEIWEGFTVSGFDSGTAGTKTITVTYKDLTTTFNVTVKNKAGACGDNVTWSLSEEGVLTISGTGDMYDYTTDERPENAPWYEFYYDITTVVIENGVTKLGQNAFRMLTNLTSVSIPNSVTQMAYGVFQNCVNLTSVSIPNSVTSLGDYVFYRCSSLTDVDLPSGITNLGVGLFYGCSSLANITIPAGITSLDYGVFEYCTGLTNIVIPASVTSIGNCAFANCNSLTTVNYQGNQKQKAEITIGNDNASLISATWNYDTQDDVELIGIAVKTPPAKTEYMLYENLDTTGLVLTLTYSDESTVDITNGFTVSGFDSSLTGNQELSVSYGGFTDYFDVKIIKGGTCGDNLTWVLDDVSGVLTISGTGAIYDYDNPWRDWSYYIHSVIIENGVTSIGAHAFAWCDYMTQITIPATVTSIHDSAFDSCYALNTVNYQGTRYQKNSITIGDWNEYLTGATWYCAAVAVYEKDGVQTRYETLEEALAETDGTVTLLADMKTETVAVKPGITLDLNGHTLTADLVVGMNGAVIRDGGADCTGGGLLRTAKYALVYAPSEEQQIIPVWNGTDGYIFTKVTIQQLTHPTGDESTARYMFLPSFSNPEAAVLLSDGGADNGLKFRACMIWNGGKSQMFYTYEDDLVSQVYDGTGRLAFGLTITGIAGITDIVLNAQVATDTGAIAASTGIGR